MKNFRFAEVCHFERDLRTLILLASSLLLIQAPETQASQYAPSNDALSHAQEEFTAHNYDKAIYWLDQVIGLNRTDPKAFMLRAKANFKLKHWQLSIDDFNKVLEYSPNYFSAFMWRASAHAKLGTDDLAIMDYEQAIRLNPRLAKRFFNPPGSNAEPKPSAEVLSREKFHLPGIMAEDLKSPAIADYKEAMHRVYPDGYSDKAPKREGGANTETYATDADDANYLEEIAAGATPSSGEKQHSHSKRTSQNSDIGSNDAETSKNAQNNQSANGKQADSEKLNKQTAASTQDNAAEASNSPRHRKHKNDKGAYQALAADPAASSSTNVEGNLDVGRSSDTLDPKKNRRAVNNVFDSDPDFGEFGAVPGSQPMKGDPELVIKRTTEALRQDRDNAEYHYLRARAYQKLQKANDAYKDYSDAIQINPQITKYFIGRASLFYQLQKPLLVDADVKRAQAIDQELPHKIEFGGAPFPPSVKWMGDGPDGN